MSYSICCSSFFYVFFSLRTFSAMAMSPLRADVHRLWRHSRWLEHHRLELTAELGSLGTLWTLDRPGDREVLEMYHNSTHAATDENTFPDYGGKGSCIALVASLSESGLGKGRASFYMEVFWGKVLIHGQDQHLRRLAWWTLNWAADFSRSLVSILTSCIFISLLYGLRHK